MCPTQLHQSPTEHDPIQRPDTNATQITPTPHRRRLRPPTLRRPNLHPRNLVTPSSAHPQSRRWFITKNQQTDAPIHRQPNQARTTSVPCRTNGQRDRAHTARGLNDLPQFQRRIKQVQPPSASATGALPRQGDSARRRLKDGRPLRKSPRPPFLLQRLFKIKQWQRADHIIAS